MSTPRPDLAPPLAGAGQFSPPTSASEAPFDTALIARLANEFFAHGDSPAVTPAPPVPALPGLGEIPGLPPEAPSSAVAPPADVPQPPVPVSAPTTVAGAPAHLPGVPTSAPTSPASLAVPGTLAEPPAVALDPAPSSASPYTPPPVHPTVVAAEPELLPAEPASDTLSGTHTPGSSDSYEFGEPRSYRGIFHPAEPEVKRAESTAIPGVEILSEPEFYFVPAGFTKPSQPGTPPLTAFDVEGVRRDFPALHQRVNGHPLIWLDNAATTHKPQAVIDATSSFYGRDNSNIHRAAHTLAARSTELFEGGREKVRQFLGASDAKEIVFVRGTTEAVNLVAQTYGRQHIGAGDEIILSQLEHHANIVPWQLLAQQTGAKLRVIPINDRGELRLEELPRLLNERTKFVSVTHVSNALGTLNPVEEIIALAHGVGVPVLVDGAQSTPHLPVNVQALDADFYVFSGHKIFGPTGIGALYGKSSILETLPPWQGGGHMIRDVTFEKTAYQHPPERFEAGTPDIAGVVGLGAAIDYLFRVGLPGIAAYEHALLEYATTALATVPGIRPIGTATTKASVFSFVIPGVDNAKIAKHLDQHGIAVRAGHHCAMPAVRHFGVEGTVRPSLAFYNTYAEVDALIGALHKLPRS